ncbi:MAG: hypothetical protein JSW05_08455 [Candidatus Thorarchaeota archaeon]|nr:MAG: hypothetical protein JSW05_08455 [Candidatus Thorarchaeota archaeon]
MRYLLNQVISVKRELKEIYYTTRNESTKADVKELVASTIAVQRILEQLLETKRKSKVAKRVLGDRKVELALRRWNAGFPRRARDFLTKRKKIEQQHLHRYKKPFLEYLENMGKELVSWSEDIETMREIPRLPKE